ncbi:nitroreductase family protein [Salibacterium halotolerans]|uniref:Putative NAD(P)H nitroreductase n=1 Tax=Salibacterium halotolerans TaxID=1884432 RepID=A0A1I5M3Y1_9BACI|nr:nitroreductase [Salibacterium halotolerans]SFP03751.1 Nitroreductase [Salibacterium halotolerans]
MHLQEGLLTRRTIYKFKKDSIDPAIIQRALESAVHAPNHKMTQPWHFYVLQREAKTKLAQRKKEMKWEGFLDKESDHAKKAGEAAYEYINDLPAVIVVTAHRYSVDPVREREDYAAVCCAVENFMLALWSEGVGSKWSTGGLVNDGEIHNIIGAGEEESAAAVLYVGYPSEIPKRQQRNVEESITWVDETEYPG